MTGRKEGRKEGGREGGKAGKRNVPVFATQEHGQACTKGMGRERVRKYHSCRIQTCQSRDDRENISATPNGNRHDGHASR